MSPSHTQSIQIDAAIVGGGIAGLWLLNLLSNKGYNVVLLEADALGSDQTLASQGMIHGGMKYALAGALSGESEAIAQMPARWRRCIAGNDEVDLGTLELLSESYYMFGSSVAGRFATLAGAKALRGRIDKLAAGQWPSEFSGFRGAVYQLNDFVVDTDSLLRCLIAGHERRALQLRADSHSIARDDNGYVVHLVDLDLHAKHLINCAGNGSGELIDYLQVPNLQVQQRPLRQVLVRPKHQIRLFGHCLTNLSTHEPRLTITTHEHDGELVWYIGGQLASEGVNHSDAEQISIARDELQRCVGWLDWGGADFTTHWVNRAEPRQSSGLKPDEAFVQREGNFIQCFPTKLTLAPDMGDKLLEVIDRPTWGDNLHSQHPLAPLGHAPWN